MDHQGKWRIGRLRCRRSRGFAVFLAWVVAFVFTGLAGETPLHASEDWLPGSISLPAASFVRPEMWNIGQSKINNFTDEDRNLTFIASFADAPTVQFRMEYWVPAYSERRIFMPLRSPQFSAARSVDVEAMLVDKRFPDVPLSRKKALFRVDTVRPVATSMKDGEDRFSGSAVSALRTSSNLPRSISHLRDRTLPPIFIGYDGVDSIAIAADQPDLDSAQLRALRQWLLAGGTVWVMIEQVDSDFMGSLLGNDWTCLIVDHVELNKFTITGGSGPVEREFEVPVDMVRLYAPGWEVIHEVRGWPASLYRTVGLGKVMLTTVGPRTWYDKISVPDPKDHPTLRPGEYTVVLYRARDMDANRFQRMSLRQNRQFELRIKGQDSKYKIISTSVQHPDVDVVLGVTKEGNQPLAQAFVFSPQNWTSDSIREWLAENVSDKLDLAEIRNKTEEEAKPHLMDLRSHFNRKVSDPPLPIGKLTEFASAQVGFEIVSRQPVAWILSLFTLAVLVGGLALGRFGRLEHLVWIDAVCVVVASVALVMVAMTLRKEVPLTVSEANIVRLVTEQQHAIVDGALAVYSPKADRGPLKSERGGSVWPKLSWQKDELLGIDHLDLEVWVWDNVKLPNRAMLFARSRHVIALDERVVVELGFGPDGAVGRIRPGQLGQVEDAILATPFGFLQPRLNDDHTFTAGPKDQLPQDEYLATAGTAIQQQRANLYKHLFQPERVTFEIVPVVEGHLRAQNESYVEVLVNHTALLMMPRANIADLEIGDAEPVRGVYVDQDARLNKVVIKTQGKIQGQLIGENILAMTVLIDSDNIRVPWTVIKRNTIKTRSKRIYPDQPTLYGWCRPLEMGYSLPQDHVSKKTTMVLMAAQLIDCEPGDRVTVPGPFISYQPVKGPTGKGNKTMFNTTTKTWIQTGHPALIVLRFELPKQVLPLNIDGGQWKVELDASGRSIETFYGDGDKLVQISHTKSIRSGFSVALGEHSQIQPDEDGAVILAFQVGRFSAGSQWLVKAIQLDVQGQVGTAGTTSVALKATAAP